MQRERHGLDILWYAWLHFSRDHQGSTLQWSCWFLVVWCIGKMNSCKNHKAYYFQIGFSFQTFSEIYFYSKKYLSNNQLSLIRHFEFLMCILRKNMQICRCTKCWSDRVRSTGRARTSCSTRFSTKGPTSPRLFPRKQPSASVR